MSRLRVRSRPGRAERMFSTSSTLRPLRSWMTRLRPVLAGQPVVEGQLGAFLPLVVDVGETQHVTHHFARRVVAVVFAHQVHAGQVQLAHRLRVRPDSGGGPATGSPDPGCWKCGASNSARLRFSDLGQLRSSARGSAPAPCGLAQTESTGVLTASGEPSRSKIAAAMRTVATSRMKRASPWPMRKPRSDQLQVHCPRDQAAAAAQRQRAQDEPGPEAKTRWRRIVPRAVHGCTTWIARRIRNGHLQAAWRRRARRRHASTRSSARAAAGPRSMSRLSRWRCS